MQVVEQESPPFQTGGVVGMGAHQPGHGLGAFEVISTVGAERGAPRPEVPEAPGLRAIAQDFRW